MSDLHIQVLGRPRVTLNDEPITGFSTVKTEALFYYLAVTGQPQSREVLADLFWGEMDEGKAKRNLTKSLSALRKRVEPYLEIERHSIAFKPDASARLDVEQFESIIDVNETEQDFNALERAIALYRGDFLEGIYVKDSLPFEEWLINRREHLRELMLNGLETLVTACIDRGDYDAGLDYANRLLELDPWREAAHRQMMTLLARSGQRSAALAQYETCRHLLEEEFGVEPTAETTALYERLKVVDAPPPHNLPPQPDAFVGREAELRQVVSNLDNANCRLLTLVGPGGVGKTRLALQGAGRYTDPNKLAGALGFPGGITLVPLAPSSGSSTPLLASVILNALRLSAPNTQEPLAYLIDHMRRAGPTLLILDNVEHFIESADQLDRLLRQAPELKLLVTSRERLNLRQEWVLELTGLTYPSSPDRPSSQPSDLHAYSAVALFLERARQVRGDSRLSEEETPAMIEICRLVDGLPLALELAAGLLKLSTCTEILAGIRTNLDYLSSSLRNLPARHRSLRAMFEHSWNLLPGDEQAVLARLSVFRGGFQQEAAATVADATRAGLAALIDKSLLRHTAGGRYALHELLRQYAAEKLAADPAEQAATLDRHSRYYAHFLQQRGGEYAESEQSDVIAELSAEADNIRAGWQHAIGPGQSLTVADINQYWYLGRFEQAAGLYHKSLAALRAPSPTWDRGLELHQQGFTAYQQGDYEPARRRLNESLSVLEAAGDPLYAARSTVILGMVAYDAGEFDEAEQLLRRSHGDLDALGESRYRSYALSTLGLTLHAAGRGRSAEIESDLRDALAISREVGDDWAVAHALKNLGSYLSRVTESPPERQEARALLAASLTRCRKINDAWGETTTLNAQGWVMLALGDNEAAATAFRQAIETGQAEQFTPAVLEALLGIGRSGASVSPAWEAAMLGLVAVHPAAGHWLRQQAGRLPAATDTAQQDHTLLLRELADQISGRKT